MSNFQTVVLAYVGIIPVKQPYLNDWLLHRRFWAVFGNLASIIIISNIHPRHPGIDSQYLFPEQDIQVYLNTHNLRSISLIFHLMIDSNIIVCNQTEKSQEVAKIKLLSPEARVPKRATTYSAGYDVYSTSTLEIPAHKCIRVPIGIAISIPKGYYGRIAPRSSISLKSIILNGGVIDADYNGEILIIMHNLGDKPFQVNTGDRVAQLIFEKIGCPVFEVVESLEETDRGTGGFGSTNT